MKNKFKLLAKVIIIDLIVLFTTFFTFNIYSLITNPVSSCERDGKGPMEHETYICEGFKSCYYCSLDEYVKNTMLNIIFVASFFIISPPFLLLNIAFVILLFMYFNKKKE